MFGSPSFMLRQKMILQKLRECQCQAVSKENAKTLEEVEVFNPNAFPKVTEDLVDKGKLIRTESQKFYVVD